MRALIAPVFIVFTACSLWVFGQTGLRGFFDQLLASPAAWQVFGDLTVSLSLVMVWVWHDARRHGRRFWPWLVETLRPQVPRRLSMRPPAPSSAPVLLTRLRALDGRELAFFTAFTTFGAPLDVTAASLRVEHFFPADDGTRRRMAEAVREHARTDTT